MPGKEVIRKILAGEKPEGAALAGVTLDGRELPARERVVAWDLAGQNLRGTVFTRLDLSAAKFEGADLAGAHFRNVNLTRASFRGAGGGGAIFEDVNLAYASFREADLRGAQFSLANLADIDFKGADLRGATVNGVRFSLNGGTHTLGLKEALRHRFGDVSYPFAAGVSGDAFWLSYLPETGALAWGGFPNETLRRGLDVCGFDSEFANVLDVEEAWRRMTSGLKAGYGAVTPLHVGGRWIAGTGFGGSEWVYVSGYEPADNAVRVRCLLGDDLLYPWDEFVRSWCIHHPLESSQERIVYTFCVVRDRREEVTPRDAILRGLRQGVEILDLGEFPAEGAVCGIPVYDLLLRDLEVEPLPGEETVGWLGLGLMHHHGSRWAIRDFLLEARRHLDGAEDGLGEAIRSYEKVLTELRTAMEILPPSLGGDGPEAEEAHRTYLENREQAGKHIRSARAGERAARDALLGVLETVGPAEE